MSDTSTQIPTFVPEPDELLEPLGRGGVQLWRELRRLKLDAPAFLKRYVPGTDMKQVKRWAKNPATIPEETREILDALVHTIDEQRRLFTPVTGDELVATVGFVGHAQCSLKILGEDVQTSRIEVDGKLETWSISGWSCIFMRQQLENTSSDNNRLKRCRCWMILPDTTSQVLGDTIEPGLKGCGSISGKLRVQEFYDEWWEAQERFNLTPSRMKVLPDRHYFSS